MKFSVGLPKVCDSFVSYIEENAAHIHEVYFSWGDFSSGRSAQTVCCDHTPWELVDMQRQALEKISSKGIRLNLLFNANCYGAESLSKDFYGRVGDTIYYVGEKFGLSSVTTTSPMIARFIKKNFENLEVRASVNMEIGSVEGMEYLCDVFDGFYMKRELNRDFDAIKKLHAWTFSNGKKLYMLANSGCLNFCSAHIFHDNLVAHEAEIAKMDNAYRFEGVCRNFLKNEENLKKLPEYTNFVRPDDIDKYEPYFVSAKLATRVHKNPQLVLSSYINRKYSGDLLRLLEPEHSIYPYALENGDPIKLVKINDSMIY